AAGVDELRALRRVLLVPLAYGEELRPRRPQLPERGGLRRQAGLLEQVLAVADAETSDIRAEADDRVVARHGLIPLPGRVALLQRLRPVAAEVDEVARLGHELPDEADLD